MQKVRDPGIEFLKYSEKKFSKSLVKPYFDPLVWNKEIGYLPGSMLKFRQNKFGMIELYENSTTVQNGVCKYDKCGSSPKSNDNNNDVTTEFTDQDLEDKPSKERVTNGIRPSLNTSSYGRQRKRRMIDGEVVGYGSKCRIEKSNRESTKLRLVNFDWWKYLREINAKIVPAKLFENLGFLCCDESAANEKNEFKLYQKLEGVDPNNESLFCVLTIVEKIGNRIRLHFDSYQYLFDFWTTTDSQLIFPAGWCDKHNRKLRPPKDYTPESFSWSNYLLKTKAEAAPDSCFKIIQNPISLTNKFTIGHKLEAVDKRNSGMICVATVKDIVGDNVLVHFDSWDSTYDMWAHHNSPLLMPVGYCEDNEKILSIPSVYGHDLSSFNWDSYLQDRSSVAVSRSVFEERSQWWFDLEIGMRCEIIDKRCPQLVRVANIVELNDEYQITIGFDDWSDKYNYKIDLGSSWGNMLPVGWSESNGCIVQPPPTYDSSIETSSCSVYGCKGYGHIKGPKYSNHQRISGCPYADCNLNKDLKTPERVSLASANHLDVTDTAVRSLTKTEDTPLSFDVKLENTFQKELEIEIPYDNSEPMDLSMKEFKDSSFTHLSNSLSIKQSETLDDAHFFDNPPGDFIPTKIKDFPNSLSLFEFKNKDGQWIDDHSFFHQYHAPKNLIPNPVAIIPLSVLRPYTSRIPYHPSDDYRRIMEWNIVEQILPSLKSVKLAQLQQKDEGKMNKILKTKGKMRRNICKKSRSTVNISEQFKELDSKKTIFDWSSFEVSQLISSVIGTNQYSKAFIEQEVDGAALLCLKQMDLMKVLGMKLGPAIKVSSGIQYLRQLYPESKLPELA